MKPLKNKICLVTGGTRGIGRAVVQAMAEAGADVAFSYQHSREQAEELTAAIGQRNVRCQGFQADVSDPEAVSAMAAAIAESLGPVAILVNNAGITRDRTFLKMTKAMWDETRQVNFDALFHVTQAVLPAMVGAGWGRIINVSSVVGQRGNFGQTNYAATKAAAIAFTMSLAREVARKGVTVNAIAPGFIETDMTKDIPANLLEQVRALTPMGRLGKPEEVADAVVFLAHPKTTYITGHVLAVNGGMYA